MQNNLKENKTIAKEDVTSWTQTIRRGYTLSFLLYSFHDLGVFEELRSEPKSAEKIAENLGLDARLLKSGLNFFVHSDNSIVKKDNKYCLTEQGKERIFADQTVAMALGAVGAYHILFTNYTAALKGEKKYGVDFERDGKLIAKASYLTGKGNYSWIVSKLEELGVEAVVDLGCGSGNILLDFCSNSEKFKGVGIDISRGAIDEASERVKKVNLEDRITLIQGDIVNPDSYSQKLVQKREKLAFNSLMVLHEFLWRGEDVVVDILKKMKKEFPHSYLLLGEFNKFSDEEFESMSLPKKMHMLFYQEIIHGMTPQGLADKETWLKLLNKAEVNVLEVKDDLPFRLVEYLVQF